MRKCIIYVYHTVRKMYVLSQYVDTEYDPVGDCDRQTIACRKEKVIA